MATEEFGISVAPSVEPIICTRGKELTPECVPCSITCVQATITKCQSSYNIEYLLSQRQGSNLLDYLSDLGMERLLVCLLGHWYKYSPCS